MIEFRSPWESVSAISKFLARFEIGLGYHIVMDIQQPTSTLRGKRSSVTIHAASRTSDETIWSQGIGMRNPVTNSIADEYLVVIMSELGSYAMK